MKIISTPFISPLFKRWALAIFAQFIILTALAQDVADTITKPITKVYDESLAYVMIAVAAVLAAVIYVLGSVFLLAIKKRLLEDKQKAISKEFVLTLIFFVIGSSSLLAQSSPVTAVARVVVEEWVVQMIGSIIILELVIIFYFAFGIRSFLKPAKLPAPEIAIENVPKKASWFDKLYQKNTDEDIARLDLGHDYDGIKELDNDIPIWWKWGFALSMVFGVIYLYNYHIANVKPLQQEELAIDMEIAMAKQEAYLAKAANNVNENTVKMLGADDIISGKALFIKPGACATCHAENGSGIVNGAPGIGPNLTDEYWLHKGDIQSVFYSIKYGWPEKGMKSWKDDYSPLQIAQLASYIKSLQGTNPSPAKEKQGELFKEAAQPLTDSGTVVKAK